MPTENNDFFWNIGLEKGTELIKKDNFSLRQEQRSVVCMTLV